MGKNTLNSVEKHNGFSHFWWGPVGSSPGLDESLYRTDSIRYGAYSQFNENGNHQAQSEPIPDIKPENAEV